MSAVELSVLIVSYNTADLTSACLRSLAASTHDTAYEVVVVDNASSDGSPDAIRRSCPDVVLLEPGTNLGFAGGMNLAARQARGRYLLLLNPDTVVLDGAVDRLVAFARAHPAHGMYGGRTLRPDGSLEPGSCWGAFTPWSATCFGLGLSALFRGSAWADPESLGRWRRDSVRDVGFISGCLLLVGADIFASLGGFDPRYFMYGEDADLGLRARAAGWRPVVTPDASVVHHVGASTHRRSDKVVMVCRAKATLVRTHWNPWLRPYGLAMLLLGVGLRAGLADTAGRFGRAGAAAWPRVWRARRDWIAGYPARKAGDAPWAAGC